jgi:hypothetical protein
MPLVKKQIARPDRKGFVQKSQLIWVIYYSFMGNVLHGFSLRNKRLSFMIGLRV